MPYLWVFVVQKVKFNILFEGSVIQVTSSEAHTSHLNVKRQPSFWTNASIVAIWNAFVKQAFQMHYSALRSLLSHHILVNVVPHTLASSTTCSEASHSAPSMSARWCHLVSSVFVFSAGTTHFRFVSHYHSQAPCISCGCCDVDVMSLKI